MKTYQYAVLIFFFIFLNTIKAQNAISFYNLGDYVTQTQNVSAVYLPKNNFTFGLPGVGFTINAPFKLNEFLVKNTTTNKLEPSFDNLLINTQAINQSTMHVNASVFMFAFKIKKGSISLFANSKFTNNWQYTKEFVKIAANGIEDFNLSNNKFNATAYHEIGLGITQQFLKDKLAIGLRLKYLNGIAHASIKDNASIRLAIDDTSRIWDIAAANATIKTSGIKIPENEKRSTFTGNTGFGMDVGATYQLSEKWVVGLDINDIGTINWSENITNYNIKDTEGTKFSGVPLDTDGNIKNEIEDALNNVIGTTETTESFSTKLTMKSFLSAKYYTSKKNVFSAVIANNHVFGNINTNYALGYNRLHKKATYGILTSIDDQNKEFKFGVNAAVNLGFFQVYAATDNLFNIFGKVEEVSHSEIYIGLNFTFGYRKTIIK